MIAEKECMCMRMIENIHGEILDLQSQNGIRAAT